MTLLSVVTPIKPLGISNTANAKSYCCGMRKVPPWLPEASDTYHCEKTGYISHSFHIKREYKGK